MPRGTKKPAKSARSDPRFQSLVGPQDQAREAFAALVKKELGSALGTEGLRRLRLDSMIFCPVGGGVVAHALFKPKRAITIENLRRYAPIVGVQANTIPLIDPVTGTALKPGVYAVRLRPVGGDRFAFDYHRGTTPPVFSTLAERRSQQLDDDPKYTIDVDLTFPPGDDATTLLPPGSPGSFCMSLFSFFKCWRWDWPDWNWPWDF
jgi:hypothetical protein